MNSDFFKQSLTDANWVCVIVGSSVRRETDGNELLRIIRAEGGLAQG
jgi:hypothetical protein